MRRVWLALLLFIAALGTAAADDFVGRYVADGVSPQGQGYKGDVQIEQVGKLHVVLWKLEGGAAYKGIAIQQGNMLGVGYGAADTKFGVAVYRVKGGTLEGVWAASRDLKSELGKETLVGSPDTVARGIERLIEQSQGGIGGVMFRAHEWADREQTLRSYELFARWVMPRFQGSLDTVVGSREWTKSHRRTIFGPNVAAIRQAYIDAGKPIPEEYSQRVPGARDVSS